MKADSSDRISTSGVILTAALAAAEQERDQARIDHVHALNDYHAACGERDEWADRAGRAEKEREEWKARAERLQHDYETVLQDNQRLRGGTVSPAPAPPPRFADLIERLQVIEASVASGYDWPGKRLICVVREALERMEAGK